MAEVWQVEDPDSGERHALKVLVSTHSRARARLAREARAQARLTHRALLPGLEILEDAGRLALKLPWVDGPDLRELLELRSLGEQEAMAIMREVAAGVAHLHRKGLVHRDIKPANILLDRTEEGLQPRLVDFGLVKAYDPALRTGLGVVLGTPAYAAPEQLEESHAVDSRADLWSLGVVLCELACGSRPFPGATTSELLRSQQGPPVLSALSPELAQLCARLLRVDVHERLDDAHTLFQALDELLGTVPAVLDGESRLARELAEWSPPGAEGATSSGAGPLPPREPPPQPRSPPAEEGLATPNSRWLPRVLLLLLAFVGMALLLLLP